MALPSGCVLPSAYSCLDKKAFACKIEFIYRIFFLFWGGTKCTKMSQRIVLSLFLQTTLFKHITYCVGQKYRQNGVRCFYLPRTSLLLVQGYKEDIPTGLLQFSNQKSAFCNTHIHTSSYHFPKITIFGCYFIPKPSVRCIESS